MSDNQTPDFTAPTTQIPTSQAPATGAGGPGSPPQPPTGFGGADEHNLPEPTPRNPTPFFVAGAIALLAIIGVVAALVFTGGDDDTALVTDDAAIATDVSTTLLAETTLPESTTTVPETTTTVPETTTTTVPETTTTAAVPTTVTETTTPAISTPIPVVTVPPAPDATLWDIIVNSPDLSQFRAAVEAADLVDLLDGPEPVTVFIPSNAAIEAFNAGVGNEGRINDPEFLRHHILTGLFTSADVFAVTELTTQAGDIITVDADAASLDGGARLIVVDILAAGSVLHVVDRVLFVQ